MGINVAIVDDHALVCDGLRLLLEANEGIGMLWRADGYQSAIGMLRDNQPDILLVDITLPGQSGIELTRWIRREYPKVKVCVLTMHANADYVYQALSAGASGYILKEAAGAEVVKAVHAMMSGERFLSARIGDMLAEYFVRHYELMRNQDTIGKLSQREYEIYKLMTEGHTNKAIAESLNLSPKTVETYKRRMMDKLNVDDLTSLRKIGIPINPGNDR